MRITDPSNRDVILPLVWQYPSEASVLKPADYQKIIETPAGIIDMGMIASFIFVLLVRG